MSDFLAKNEIYVYVYRSEGWENVEYVGTTKDLDATLQEKAEQLGNSKVAHVRALSFSFPQPSAMEEVAVMWRNSVKEVGGPALNPADYLFDDDDDEDEDDDDEWEPEIAAGASATLSSSNPDGEEVVSPFDPEKDTSSGIPVTTEGVLPLTKDNVDKVLDEVRPYLIADGGNVAVEGIDEEKGEVFLKLQGACGELDERLLNTEYDIGVLYFLTMFFVMFLYCLSSGSCASSTVTMEMGIERVLKENFAGFSRVVQVEDPETAVTELTWEAVEAEFNRIYPAIMAMGGVAKLVKVDSDLGVVEMTFRGSNKIRQGLELAIMDVPFVNRVEFIMEE